MTAFRPPLFACIAALLAALAFPFVPFLFLQQRIDSRIDARERELASVTKRLEHARAAQRKWTQFQEEQTRLTVELDKLRMILPNQRDEAAVLRLLNRAAVENHVRVEELRHTADHDLEMYVQSDYEVSLSGSPGDLRGFFRDVGNAPNIVSTSSLELRNTSSGWRGRAGDFHAIPSAGMTLAAPEFTMIRSGFDTH